MRAYVLVLLASPGFAPAVQAHDFWVQPNSYWLSPDATVPLTLQVGHGPFRQRSPIHLNRILRFTAVGPEGRPVDLRDNLHPGEATADGSVRLQAPGTYVLVMETDDRAQSHLPALRFNDYLHVEGLTPALAERERTHRMGADGAESYSRCAKSIVQVGPPPPGPQTDIQQPVTQPVGLSLEIIPEVSPYAQPRPAQLPVRVIYEGRRLEGALIKLTDLAHDEAPLETHRTDRNGRAVFAMPRRGAWLLNVIWTRPLPRSRETDFATVFSSLSFGLPD